jgi:hypothetical protein
VVSIALKTESLAGAESRKSDDNGASTDDGAEVLYISSRHDAFGHPTNRVQ